MKFKIAPSLRLLELLVLVYITDALRADEAGVQTLLQGSWRCDANGVGCVHGECDAQTGRCVCHEGYEGTTCEKCKTYVNCRGKCLTQPYECICPEGRGGLNCDKILTRCMRERPCQNGGICRNGDDNNTYTCECQLGFYGVNCEQQITSCDVSPCQNDGKCVSSPSHPQRFRCVCRPGTLGRFCQSRAVDCRDEPCQNGATCMRLPSSAAAALEYGMRRSGGYGYVSPLTVAQRRLQPPQFQCACTPGWAGTVCDTPSSWCAPGMCQNGGLCVEDSSAERGYTCKCAEGWEGVSCERNVDDCKFNPCQNNGICIDKVGGFQCRCAHGFRGPLCEENAAVRLLLSTGPTKNGPDGGETDIYRTTLSLAVAEWSVEHHVEPIDSKGRSSGTASPEKNDTSDELATPTAQVLIAFFTPFAFFALLVLVMVLAVRNHRRCDAKAQLKSDIGGCCGGLLPSRLGVRRPQPPVEHDKFRQNDVAPTSDFGFTDSRTAVSTAPSPAIFVVEPRMRYDDVIKVRTIVTPTDDKGFDSDSYCGEFGRSFSQYQRHHHHPHFATMSRKKRYTEDHNHLMPSSSGLTAAALRRSYHAGAIRHHSHDFVLTSGSSLKCCHQGGGPPQPLAHRCVTPPPSYSEALSYSTVVPPIIATRCSSPRAVELSVSSSAHQSSLPSTSSSFSGKPSNGGVLPLAEAKSPRRMNRSHRHSVRRAPINNEVEASSSMPSERNPGTRSNGSSRRMPKSPSTCRRNVMEYVADDSAAVVIGMDGHVDAGGPPRSTRRTLKLAEHRRQSDDSIERRQNAAEQLYANADARCDDVRQQDELASLSTRR